MGPGMRRAVAGTLAVVDGDTIHARVTTSGRLRGDQSVRFIGIDTPYRRADGLS